MDGDHDGIADDADLCPETPATAGPAWTDDGCPAVDGDGDTVPDAYDACPTIREITNGFEDGDGCPDEVGAALRLSADRVLFATGSHDLGASARASVASIVASVLAHPEITHLRIEGHADSRGDPQANFALSERRARAVRSALVEGGVTPDRVHAVGLGALPGDLPEIQTANRRVDVIVALRDDPRDGADLASVAGSWISAGHVAVEVGARPSRSALVVLAGAPAWLGPAGSRLACYAGRFVGDRLSLHCRGVGVDVTFVGVRRGTGAIGRLVGRRGTGVERVRWLATEVRLSRLVAAPAGCSVEGLGDRLFAFCPELVTWDDARARCAAVGWRLATIDAVDESALVLARAGGGVWIGLSDAAEEGAFRWVDGSSVSWAPWCGGEPNDEGGAEDCVLAVQAAPWCASCPGWNDGGCGTPLPYVCEHVSGPSVAGPAVPAPPPSAPTCNVAGSYTGTATRAADGAVLLVMARLAQNGERVTGTLSFSEMGMSLGDQDVEGAVTCAGGRLILRHASGVRFDAGFTLRFASATMEITGGGSSGLITDLGLAGSPPENEEPSDEETISPSDDPF